MWWEILKNQISSTKGKQFQLDFSKPMIEEEDCRKRFLNMAKKVAQLTMGGTVKSKRPDLNQINYNIPTNNYEAQFVTVYNVENIGKIPEEVFCRAIEEFKTGKDRNIAIPVGNYQVFAYRNYEEPDRNYYYVSSGITIYKDDDAFGDWAHFHLSFSFSPKHFFEEFKPIEEEKNRLINLYQQEVNKL